MSKVTMLNLTTNQTDWSKDSTWDFWDYYNLELTPLNEPRYSMLKSLLDFPIRDVNDESLDYAACKIVELVDDISGGEPMATVINSSGYVTTRLVHALVNGGYTVNFPVFDRHSGRHINFVSADPTNGEG